MKRAITKKLLKIFFQNFTKYFSHHPLSADTSFKCLSLILFEIWHLQNFKFDFSKGHNFTRGDNSKKKVCVIYLEPPYTHTHGQAKTNMSPTFSKLGALLHSVDEIMHVSTHKKLLVYDCLQDGLQMLCWFDFLLNVHDHSMVNS